MSFKCDCGKVLDDMRGARGHFQFTTGEVNGVDHGPDGEVPDGYKDRLTEESDDEGDDDADDDADAPDEADTTPDTKESQSEPAGGSQAGRLKRLLTTPLDELLGGGS